MEKKYELNNIVKFVDKKIFPTAKGGYGTRLGGIGKIWSISAKPLGKLGHSYFIIFEKSAEHLYEHQISLYKGKLKNLKKFDNQLYNIFPELKQ